ncbi:MAG: TRAP transporter large permease [Alcaligenaceae bacterium]|jgi:tripartite ATP-independent transporter DctM subunit|nr:TRAP transporter large permease [Alcaligenaceae bacterium]
MDPMLVTGLAISLIFIFMAIGTPVFAALGLSGIFGVMMLEDLNFVIHKLQAMPYYQSADYLLTVIPLFILMGAFVHHSGIGETLFGLARKWVGHMPGGLAMASILTCAGFAATSGSSVATSATVGAVAIPEMKKAGYDSSLSAGAVAAGGVLGVLIPPSVLLVFYAALTEVSAGKMLIAGIIPGLLSTFIFIIGIRLIAKKVQNKASVAEKESWKNRFLSLKDAWQITILFIVVLGGIYAGIMTPTEAAAIGTLCAFFMLLFSKKGRQNFRRKFYESCRSSITTTVMIMITMIGAGIFSYFLNLAQIPQLLSGLIANSGISGTLVIVLFLILYFPLGMFLDAFSMLVITLPIMFPTVKALGFDPIWFGILAVKMCEIGLITPPVGLNIFVIAGIDRETPLTKIFVGAWWFVLMEIFTLTLLFYFPLLTTWLPAHTR